MSSESSHTHHHHHSSGSHSSESHKTNYHRDPHRHSSHRSHRPRRERSSDRKAYRKSRYLFAFILFLSVTVFSLSLTARFCLLSADNVANIFVNHTYVSALSDDVLTYATDLCRSNNIPASAAEDVVTYSAVNEIDRAYIIGTLSLDEKYTKTSYEDKLTELVESLEESIKSTLEQSGIKTYSGMKDEPAQLAKSITDYLSERMIFSYFDKVEAALNIGKTASFAAVVVSGIISVALILIVIALGSKLYRNLRSVCHAFSASAIVSFLIPIVYSGVKSTKALGFYPTYLNDSIMSFLNNAVSAYALTGVILTVLSFALMAVVWTLKSEDLDA